MLHRTTKIVAIISGFVFLVSASVTALFFVMVEKEKKVYEERTLALAQANSDQESLRTLMTTLEETKVERESLVSRVLKDEEVINFLALLESLGSEQGVVLTTNSLKVEPINETFETLLINLDVEGSRDSVLRMLRLFETLPYQVFIESVQLSRADGSGAWKGLFELRVTKLKKI